VISAIISHRLSGGVLSKNQVNLMILMDSLASLKSWSCEKNFFLLLLIFILRFCLMP
jgi:hypothetical protein